MKQPEMEKEPRIEQSPENAEDSAGKQDHTQQKPHPPAGIVQPMIDELRQPKDAPQGPQAPPRGPVHPPEPAELDQDDGGGYNPDGTYPQT